MPLSASQHEEVLSVPNDLSGLLSVIPIALFGSEAVRATGSLILSFAGVKRHERVCSCTASSSLLAPNVSIAPMYSYVWSRWHVGTGSSMVSCMTGARVEGRRRIKSVLGQFTLPSTTFHRHPHCTCVTQRAPNTGTSTYARKSWGGHPRCDLAPLTTSFGTVGQWERQHLAMTATCPEGEAWAASRNWNHGTHFLWDPRAAPTFLHLPRNATAHSTVRSTFQVHSGDGTGGVMYQSAWLYGRM